MKAYYHDLFTFPLPPGHRFPIQKYHLLRQRLLAERLLSPKDLQIPAAASDDQLGLVHHPAYIDKVKHGGLTEKELRRIGFPWSPELVERSRRSVGSTIAACRSAMEEGLAANLAGGTHHAFADYGAGFCVFNDVAVGTRVMQAEGRTSRILILDCDVHQGDGSAAIFARDASVFTFSIHSAKNYPFRKQQSDLDISLPDGCEDGTYLQMLSDGMQKALQRFSPELVIFLSGADPYKDDRLGRLALSKSGLAERDHMVLSYFVSAGLPVAIVMGGGYARNVTDTVDIHLNTLRIATQFDQRNIRTVN